MIAAIPYGWRVAIFVAVLVVVCARWLWWSLEDRDL